MGDIVSINKRKPHEVLGERIPVLMNLQDVSEYTQYSKQRIRNNIHRQHQNHHVRDPFPLPFTYLSNGGLWTKKQIDTFLNR